MTEEQMQNITAKAYSMSLQINYNNLELATLSNFVNGFGRVASGTKAYEKALNLSLIKNDGKPPDGLADALIREYERRVAAGTFV